MELSKGFIYKTYNKEREQINHSKEIMSKRVMIFDDDLDILSICSYILEEQGWEVFTSTHCNNITENVEKVKPDVILMDNWIPETGGIIATQTLKKDPDLKGIPVIYFSANNDIQSLAKQAGADTYLEKPFDLTELEEIINRVIKKNENQPSTSSSM